MGNALEVLETVPTCVAMRARRACTMTLALAAEMLVLGHLAPDLPAARAKLQAALDSGAAAESLRRWWWPWVAVGPALVAPEKHLPAAPIVVPVPAPCTGVLTGMATRDPSMLVVEMGGGRRVEVTRIDMRVGFSAVRPWARPARWAKPFAASAADTAQAESRPWPPT